MAHVLPDLTEMNYFPRKHRDMCLIWAAAKDTSSLGTVNTRSEKTEAFAKDFYGLATTNAEKYSTLRRRATDVTFLTQHTFLVRLARATRRMTGEKYRGEKVMVHTRKIVRRRHGIVRKK